MTQWKWISEFSVGIKEIDEQHKQLIDFINELKMAYAYDKMYMIEEVIEKLLVYTKYHFSFEEDLMQKAEYLHLAAHKKAHESFIQRILFFKERYANGENIAKQLRNDLQLWVVHHIQHDDFDYKNSVQEVLKIT
jgi:hemerythrin